METDALQTKIENARKELSEESRRAIDTIDWRKVVLEIKTKMSLTIEQTEDLELETELMLCGILPPEEYEKEIRERVNLSPRETSEIIQELNERVFERIRVEFDKLSKLKSITENKKVSDIMDAGIKKETEEVLGNAGLNLIKEENKTKIETTQTEERVDMLQKIERPELIAGVIPASPIDKLSQNFALAPKKTEYSLDNMTKQKNTFEPLKAATPKIDPYRMPVE